VRVPMAELAGEIRGVGEPAGPTSCEVRPRRERSARWKEALRRFRRRRQTNARHITRISARTEHTPIAALPCAVRLLPDVVDAAADAAVGVELSVATEGAEVGCETTTAGVGFARVAVVVVVRGVVLLVSTSGGAVRDCDDGNACGTCSMVTEQPLCVSGLVLHRKPGGGGPGSRMSRNAPILSRPVSLSGPPRRFQDVSLLAGVDDQVDIR
jgi:hypothetical protein